MVAGKKAKMSVFSKRINALTKKLNANAPLLKKAAEQPDYGGRFAPLTWEQQRTQGKSKSDIPGAPGYTRQVGERSYSMLKVAQLGMGMIEPKDAVEEVQLSQKLANMFSSVQFSSALYAGKSWLVPFHTDYLPTNTPQNASLVSEIKQKMAFTVNPDEMRHLGAKGWTDHAKALGTLADTAGGSFVQGPQIIELLEMQYKIEAWTRAGAMQIPMMPNGRAFISKIQSGSTAFYADEGVNFAAQSSQPKTGQLLLVAKKIAVIVPLNNELLRFGMPATETMVRYDMARQAALFIDSEQFAGTGGTHIAGLLSNAYPSQTPPWAQGTDAWLNYNLSPVAPSGLGTNGNTFQPQDVDRMCNTLPDEITPDEITFLMTRTLYGGISSRRATALTSGDEQGVFVGQRLIGLTKRINEDVEGYRTVWSSNVPTNRKKGSGTNLTCAIAGRFSDWVNARLGVGEIVSNSFADTFWFADQTGLRLIQQFDAGARYVASFVVYDDLVNG